MNNRPPAQIVAKFFLLIAVIIVLFMVFRALRKPGRTPTAARPDSQQPGRAEDMVRCRVCGVHLPRSEAITSRGEFFCSQEHLRLADRSQGR
jgi:uncharacterized protein